MCIISRWRDEIQSACPSPTSFPLTPLSSRVFPRPFCNFHGRHVSTVEAKYCQQLSRRAFRIPRGVTVGVEKSFCKKNVRNSRDWFENDDCKNFNCNWDLFWEINDFDFVLEWNNQLTVIITRFVSFQIKFIAKLLNYIFTSSKIWKAIKLRHFNICTN